MTKKDIAGIKYNHSLPASLASPHGSVKNNGTTLGIFFHKIEIIIRFTIVIANAIR
jgi:hypothetical protein